MEFEHIKFNGSISAEDLEDILRDAAEKFGMSMERNSGDEGEVNYSFGNIIPKMGLICDFDKGLGRLYSKSKIIGEEKVKEFKGFFEESYREKP